MLFVIFGESCTGKSTLAQKIAIEIPAEILAGKDYLRLAKNEEIAKKLFVRKMQESVHGDNLIYVIAEKEYLCLIPEGAVRILVTADIDTIKERFAKRMGGNLPAPVATMLERKHCCFDNEPCDFHVNADDTDLDALVQQLRGEACGLT
jgi:predicted kinase